MTRRAASLAITVVIGITLVLASSAGCTLNRAAMCTGQVLIGSAQPPSLLTVILGSTSGQAHAAFNDAVVVAARTGEQVVVIAASGRTLGVFRAPSPPRITGPCVPVLPGSEATSFQVAQYDHTLARALAAILRDRQMLRFRQRRAVQAWARGAVAQAWSVVQRPDAGAPILVRSVSAAVAYETAFEQAGRQFGDRTVVGLIGISADATPPMHFDASLAGMTVVMTGIADSLADASWQAALLQAGAARAYVLPPAADSLLPGLISRGLTGHDRFPFIVTGLDYGPGQYALPRSALRSLRGLLILLTIRYPTATATINGYTDNVPVPGGNLLLSWKRAHAVLGWLVDHGVAPYRLQATGHGSAEPVAPNNGGQPLNRRVVVIVSPG